MLFNSYAFIFLFLPLVVVMFFVMARFSHGLAVSSLAIASVVFYSWWSWRFTPILLASVVANYLAARGVERLLSVGRPRPARNLLALAVGLDLTALGYFKYMNFFADVIRQVTGSGFEWVPVVLPIGISFFTFTQIAFLVDTYHARIGPTKPIHYLLFVTYFPHLIAGPILHHSEMMPQFRRERTYRPDAEAISVGMTVFAIGLMKKVFVADSLASYANLAFDPAHVHALTTPEAWRGVLAYTLQIYFDFSAYCDMAIGVSRMLNVTLPANFESPYKSLSITDFWRRWHMTLSRFLRDYLYIPLGGSRRGKARRYANLMATMVLGGLWHGAGWNFLIWGALHGGYLCVNHAWSSMVGRAGSRAPLPRSTSWLLTFFAVMVAWVFFRADDLPTAFTMIRAMFGMGTGPGISLSGSVGEVAVAIASWSFGGLEQAVWLGGGLLAVLALPNLRQVMSRHELVLGWVRPGSGAREVPVWLSWRPDAAWAGFAIALLLFSVMRMNRVSQFLYFQF